MPVTAMMPMVAAMPALMTMPTMMTAPANFRRDILGGLLRGCRCGGVNERHRLRVVDRCGNRKQARNSGKSEDRLDIHLHEFSPLVSGFENELRLHVFHNRIALTAG